MTSKGQVTVPKQVRDALGIQQGDQLHFRVVGDHAILARTPAFLDLAGSVRVPPGREGVAWEVAVAATRARRTGSRR
ncbi:MAG: AbrB/MazE/SpoVT family DNA-binding domain-containing protein [Chloroflexota bacterium]